MEFKLTSSQMNFYTRKITLDDCLWNQGVMQVFSDIYTYEQLNDAYNCLVKANDSLRVRMKETDNGPVMVLEEFQYTSFPFWQVSTEEELMITTQKFLNEPIDPYGRLVKCAVFQTPYSSGLMISAHHFVVDGFSSAVMADHINHYLHDGNYVPPANQNYSEYVENEEKHKQSKRFVLDQKFWKKQFSTDPVCNIVSNQKNAFDFAASELNCEISQALFEKIKVFCKENDISPATFFNTVYATYIYKRYEVESFTLGVPVLNRTTQAELNTIGLYMHLVPMVVNIQQDSFLANAQEIEDSQMNLFRHQRFTQQDIKDLLKENKFSVSQLFDVFADYEELTQHEDFEISIHYSKSNFIPLEIHLFNFGAERHQLKIRYRTAFLKEHDIRLMMDSIVHIAAFVVDHADVSINDIPLYSENILAETIEQIKNFNNTAETYPSDKNINEIIEAQAEKTPDTTAVTAKDKILTYAELIEESNKIANALIEKGVKKSDIVAFMLPRRSYLFPVMLGILKTGAAYMPIDPDYPEDRIEYMLTDSKAKYCVTQENVQELLNNKNTSSPNTQVNSTDICYCIYTSGSTGNPKGTLLTHRNVVNYVSKNKSNVANRIIKDNYKSIVSVTTVGFDIFVTESLLPLANGMEIVLADEDESRLKNKLDELIKENPVDVIQTTPTKMKTLMGDYLKTLKAIILGGEALDSNLVREIQSITDAKIYNIYGPTEATVWVTTEEMTDSEDIHIGKPMANTQIYIVDKNMKPVPVGVTGELCIAGDCVGAGYLNRDELTQEKFIENPFGEGKMYRTGDIAYWREDGNIGYVGRNDFQVKIRGLRIELGEIENAITSIKGIEQAVTIVRKNNEGRQLICAFYTGEEKEAQTIRTEISKKLPKYMVPHIFTHMEEMPMTSSGKINRKALPEIDLENIDTSAEYVAPETEEEKILEESVKDVLGNEEVSMLDNFFDIGGDSLKAIELTSRLEAKGYETTVKTIFECENMQNLAKKLTVKEKEEEKVEYTNIIPATAAQMRVYTSQFMSPETPLYNIPNVFKVEKLNAEKLQEALNKLIERHEALRTRFENKDGQIVQIIEDQAEIRLQKLENDNIQEFIKPFDLTKAPLIRAGYFKNTVMIDIHHIIADGETMPVFFRELNELYMGRSLEKAPVQYGEFSVQETNTEESEKYWLDIFSDEISDLELPTDYQRKTTQSFNGTMLYDRIEKELHERITKKSKELNITPYVFYMTCYNILLSKYSGNEDILVGMPISGRNSKYLETVGMFVNTVALRSKPEGNKTISQFMQEVKENSILAMDNQNYPFNELVKKLNIQTNGRNPIFDVMLAYQSYEMTDIDFGDKKAELMPIPTTTAKCDVNFNIMPRENDVVLAVEYCTELYKETTVQKFINSFKLILEQCLYEKTLIKDIEVKSEEETKNVLFNFNNTAETYPSDKNINEIIEAQAEKTPDATAVTAKDKILTYAELIEESNKIANALIEKSVKKGDIVAFMLPRRSYLFPVMLGILKTGAAYMPIDPDYPEDRIEYMLEDSKAKYCVTQENVQELLNNKNTSSPNTQVNSTDICYCIYTSGSTGNPKGTLLTHRNVVNYVSKNKSNVANRIIKDNYKSIVSVTTVGFDIFVTESLLPLANGMEIVLADEDESRLKNKLDELIKENPVDVIQTTPTKMKTLMGDYLKTLKAIILGGEALDSNLVKDIQSITDAKIYNIYGPTEATVWVTTEEMTDSEDIHIGKPMANTQIYIVDKNMKPVPVGVTGELCIAGDCVGAGYLNRDELTQEKFIKNPFGKGKMYRTGDIAYWREDGNIGYVGRNDFQVKIRGLRIELGEIENAITSIKGIEQAVTIVRKNNEGRQLICAFYTGEEKEAQTIRTEISKKLPKYMVPHIFTHMEEMPMTSSGKINRKALPEIDLENIDTSAEYVAAETEEEKILEESVKDVLGNEEVSMLDNFFDIGGDSLKAIELTSRLEAKGYETTVKTIFECENMQNLAKKLTVKEKEEEKVEYTNIIPATAAQMRVYTSQFMSPETPLYNIPNVFRVKELNAEKLELALNKLIARHEALRTRFENKDGQIVQIIEDTASVKLQKLQSENTTDFIKAFDLTKTPLIRAGYFKNTVMIDIHHIIADGETMPVFFRELNELYMGRSLEKAPVQYGEFSVQETNTEENEKYWLDIFSDEISDLELPTDYQRKTTQSFNGTMLYDRIEKELHERITKKSKELNITPYVFYMTCYNILLSKYSGNEDIVVGMPISGRTGKYLETVGMFVNTVALRSKPEGNKTISQFMQEVKENSILAMDNQNYPFNELVKKLNIQTNGRNPIFDVMLAYQSYEMTDIVFADSKAELLPIPTTTAKCDMNFNIMPRENDVVFAVEYCTELYKEETVQKFINSFKLILEQCLEENMLIKDIEVKSEKETKNVLFNFNNTAEEYEKSKSIHEIIEAQAEKTPDTTAVTAKDKILTYAELIEESNKIANALIEKGVKKSDIVAFMLPRRSYLFPVMLGILKTGAAYMPIDPDYPEDRIEYMLEDSGAKICVTQENVQELLNNKNTSSPNTQVNSTDICYCIYTSGSTGNPKGTLLTHRNVVNYVSASNSNVVNRIIKDNYKSIVSVTTVGFDIFVTESLLPLANGMEIVLADEDESRLKNKLDELIKENPVDVIQTTPTKMKTLMGDYLKTLKAIILGGEALDSNLVKDIQSITDAKIYNIYGPTEATVWVTTEEMTDSEDIHIGKPMANTQIYIVDKNMKPVPVGVTGELCIAGDCVGAGYLNRDELTQEKFIKNPFGKGKMYRTGDIAYWREDGNIGYVGRNDFQVKIRGLRIELGEIENAITSIKGIEQAVTIVRKNNEGRQLICAFYTGEEKEAQTIRTEISKKLPKYMVPHIFTHMEEMPMTSSGKINRKALPEIDLENIDTSAEYVAPETEEEKILEESVKDVLGNEEVSMLDNFFDIGGDSLKAIELTSRLEAKGYETTVKTIFECENMQNLAKKLTVKETQEEKVEYTNIIPATAAQMRVYTSQFMSPETPLYNIPNVFRVEELNTEKLEAALNKLIARHEALRTRFENKDGQIVQIIEDKAEIRLQKLENDNTQEFIKPFDLTKAPLIRAGYYENTVMIDIHHIIADGETMPVFFRELNELYMGRKLKENPVQYGEFAVQETNTEENEKYWLDIFSDEIPDLELPTDYQRKTTQSFKGTMLYDRVEKEVHDKITEKCKELNITPYVYYMTCYNILLSKYSGNEDILVGMPISGRTGKYLETVGMFVNTVALRSKPEGNKTISQFMQEVKENSILAMDNQNYPFNELVKKLNIQTNGRNPIFDVMLAYQSYEMTDIDFGDKKAELMPIPTTTAKCDVNFNIMPRENDVVFAVEYCTELYKETTVQKFINSFKLILEQCLEENMLIKDITAMSEDEKQKILYDFNATAYEYDVSEASTVYSLFENTASKIKSKTCVTANGKSITFGELLTLSEVLDSSIRKVTNGKKSIIAVIAERSVEMYSAIYGIIRGGNAYMPIAPDYPQDRIEYMLKNSNAAMVVAQGKFAHLAGSVPCVDMTEFISDTSENDVVLPCAAEADDTAYVIYTSGSTGKPKGAKVSHRSAVNRILWMHDAYPLGADDVILQKTPYTFDVSVWELFWWGMVGGSLVASKPDEHFLSAKILDEVYNNKVTHLHFVPSVFELFVTYLENHRDECYKFSSVRYVFLSGEALSASLVTRFYDMFDFSKVGLHNLYGPTECAVDVTYYDCSPEDTDPVPIGRPIYNTAIYIVDKYMNCVPQGVMGELCIGGMNVGQGYLNNPTLTQEKFLPNPFGDGRIYRTGDNAYIRDDGEIIFCGRMDNQIKLNGQRIEIGEIETVIGNIDGVDSVAVIVRKNNGRDILAAFWCGKDIDEKIIRNICEKELPSYMIPGAICQLDKLPLNPSGKLDRKVLSAMEIIEKVRDEYEAPENDDEVHIAEVFGRILGIDMIGRNSDFFELGGTSLAMIALLSEDGFKDVSAADFIANPTPRKLSKLMSEDKINEFSYIRTLKNIHNSKKALVLIPYAGGGAEAFAALVNSFGNKSDEYSLYYIDYLRSFEDCKAAAKELSEIAKSQKLYIYSHCAGSAVAMQIINILEEMQKGIVEYYVAGASIPPEKPNKNNFWNTVSDEMLASVLMKAGAPFGSFSEEQISDMLMNFRKDTDFMTECFYKDRIKVNCPVSVIISKDDLFTDNFADAERLWKLYAENVRDIHFIDSQTHYFQSDNSDELAEMILPIITE